MSCTALCQTHANSQQSDWKPKTKKYQFLAGHTVPLRLKSMLVRKQPNEMTLDVEGISERVVPGQAGIIMQLVLQMRDGA